MKKILLVIILDRLSVLINKGEVVPRYYNPGSLFDEVHIIMTNDDKPEASLVQPMVGNAKLFLHNYPISGNFLKTTLGYRPILMQKWAHDILKILKMRPDIIRCHGIHLNVFLAIYIKKHFNIPVVVSLHGNPDIDYFRGRLACNMKRKLIGLCDKYLEKYCLKSVDHVIAVYSPIIPYLEGNSVKNYSVIYNVVALGVSRKENYNIKKSRVNLLCVGRQTWNQKDPSNIIKAVSSLPNMYLTLVGEGDLQKHLVQLAKDLECKNRIKFVKSISNKDLCEYMRDIDIYVYHSVNYELSKSCIEAALIGLPIIVNNRNNHPANELKDAKFYIVPDSPDGYKNAILKLAENSEYRNQLADHIYQYAQKNWNPDLMEEKLSNLYSNFLG